MKWNLLKDISSKIFPKNIKITIIILLTLLATLLRLLFMNRPLSGDEAATYYRFGFAPWKTLLFSYPWTNQHTLFNILSQFCMNLFGENEIAFRLPSLLAGIFAVPLIYWTCLFFLNSQTTAAISSFLLTLSIPHLKYTQEGRGYTMTVFFALMMVLIIKKLIEE